MTEEQLERANKLKKQIDDLETFIFLAGRDGFWERIMFKKETTLFVNVLGYKDDATEFRLNKDLTLKVLELLEQQKREWEEELKQI